jgi:acyl-CoA synthetase (AMP-forming)/AMP-acid ligase II
MNIDFILEKMLVNKNDSAIVTNGCEYTFGDILQKYEGSKNILSQNSIEKGSIVSVIAEFSPLSIALFLALIENDSIIVPISKSVKSVNDYNRVAEVGFVIDLSDDVNVKAAEIGAIVKHPMLCSLIEKQHPGLILFSSGTIGEPKVALHDMVQLIEKFKKTGKKISTVTFLLFDHIGGFNTMMHSLSSGSLIVTLKERSSEEVCRLIAQYHVELLPASPTFINMILLSRAYERFDLSSLKMISYGTEPMPESTLKTMHKIMPNVKLKQTYGLSELGIMSTKSESSDSLYMKIGGDGFETKIVDDILYIRAKSAMLGYLNAPSPFDEEGWFNTKDKVEVKGEYLKILGRTTDLINVGGEKVYPNEIESFLLSID